MKTRRLLFVVFTAVMVSSCGTDDQLSMNNALQGSLPTVTEIPYNSGQRGHPFNAAPTPPPLNAYAVVIDLAGAGYVEREFMMSGTTNTYNQSGLWTSNGRWQVSVAKSNVPYVTRLLARYPTNPAKFNGTVVIEWFNETTYSSADPDWSESREFFLREGYAYVGVTAQNGQAGPPFLKNWDPARYGKLVISTDAQSYDIFTQAAQIVKTNSSTLLGGLVPKKVLGAGDSQSAFRLVTYVNAIHPRARAYNGFLIHGRGGTMAPIGDGLLTLTPFAQIRTDNTTPVIQFQAEGDLVELYSGWARQPDNNYLRTWEIPGAAHIDLYEAAYQITTAYRDTTLPVPKCSFGVITPITGAGQANSMPNHRLENAAWAALNRWVNTGVPAPSANRIQTILFPNIVAYDLYGNAKGGIRLPEIEVPIKTYSSWNTSTNNLGAIDTSTLFSLLLSMNTSNPTYSINPTNLAVRELGLCLLSGFDTPFDAATLKRLYPTHADYVSKYTAAAKKLLNAGFLTQFDYNEAVAEAQAAAVP